ncbi:MAG: hypothetical protein ACKV1O_18990 [Saprospiraceae bacterium]
MKRMGLSTAWTARLEIKTGLIAEKDDVFGELERGIGEEVLVVHGDHEGVDRFSL